MISIALLASAGTARAAQSTSAASPGALQEGHSIPGEAPPAGAAPVLDTEVRIPHRQFHASREEGARDAGSGHPPAPANASLLEANASAGRASLDVLQCNTLEQGFVRGLIWGRYFPKDAPRQDARLVAAEVFLTVESIAERKDLAAVRTLTNTEGMFSFTGVPKGIGRVEVAHPWVDGRYQLVRAPTRGLFSRCIKPEFDGMVRLKVDPTSNKTEPAPL